MVTVETACGSVSVAMTPETHPNYRPVAGDVLMAVGPGGAPSLFVASDNWTDTFHAATTKGWTRYVVTLAPQTDVEIRAE